MPIQSEYINVSVKDASLMRAFVAYPVKLRAQAGILVFQEAFGVNAHIRDVTERLAREGFYAIAPELYHRTKPGFEGNYNDLDGALIHSKAMKDPETQADINAAYDWILAHNNEKNFPVSAVGFCMGGRVAFLAALTLPLVSSVSFYGGGIAPTKDKPGLLNRVDELRSPLLMFWGGQDKHLGPSASDEVVKALREAKKDYENVEFSMADHGFFCDMRQSYQAFCAAQAWSMMLAFLKNRHS